MYMILLLNARMVECYQGRQQAAGQHSLLQQPLEHGVLLHHEDEAGGGDQVTEAARLHRAAASKYVCSTPAPATSLMVIV